MRRGRRARILLHLHIQREKIAREPSWSKDESKTVTGSKRILDVHGVLHRRITIFEDSSSGKIEMVQIILYW